MTVDQQIAGKAQDVLAYHGIKDVCCAASVDADRQEPNIGLSIGAVAAGEEKIFSKVGLSDLDLDGAPVS